MKARDLIKVLSEAKQVVPPELSQMAGGGGYSGGFGGGAPSYGRY